MRLKPSVRYTGNPSVQWADPGDLYRHQCIAQQFQTPRLKTIQECRAATGAWVEDRCAAKVMRPRGGGTFVWRQCKRPSGFGPDGMYCGVHGRAIAPGPLTRKEARRLYDTALATQTDVAQAARLAHKEAAKQREVVECRVRFIIPSKRHMDHSVAFEADIQMTREQLDTVQRAHARDELIINWIKGGA